MRCPVCQARFRGTRRCSRCGADLEPLMRLALRAWRLRESARQAFAAGNLQETLVRVEQAQHIHAADSGQALRLLIAWLSQ